jgi:hypothetical protein
MDNPLYTIHNRALAAESMLNADERRLLEDTAARLIRLPEKEWESRGGPPLATRERRFLFDLSPSLRVFLRPGTDGRPEVMDFVTQEFLDWWESLDETKESAGRRKARSRS